MSIIRLSTTTRNARAAAVRDQLDAGAGPGYIELYTAPMPATGGEAITTQTKLGTLTLADPSVTIDAGILTFGVIADDVSADASGDIAWGRFFDSVGTFVMDGDAGLTASSALLKFNTLAVVAGGAIEIISGTLTEGNA